MLPIEMFMTFLYGLGLTGNQTRAGNALGHSKTTNARMTKLVLQVLFDYLVPRMIKWPTVEEAKREARAVSERHTFPMSVFLFVDGTYIKG